MTVVAFLQNMWFKDPERMKKVYAHYLKREEDGLGRQRFIRDFLFFGCKTGKMLDKAFEPVFGDEWRWKVWWEEAHDQWGGHAASSFGFNARHMADVLVAKKPTAVLLFGKVASDGFAAVFKQKLIENYQSHLIIGPHPAARGPDVAASLSSMACDLAAHLGEKHEG